MTLKTMTTRRAFYVPAILASLTLSVLAPYLVHLLPAAGHVPLGARLLPMYFTPLLAVLFWDPVGGIVTALLAPALNHLITGMPVSNLVGPLTLELAFFSLIVTLLHSRFPRFWGTGAVAFASAKALALVALAVVVALTNYEYAAQPFIKSTITALPGICILLVLNIAVVRKSAHGR